MRKFKFKGYKEFEGCPKCGGFDYESFTDGFDYFNHKYDLYVAIHNISTCSNCGCRFEYDEIFKYDCDAVKNNF